MSAWRIGAGVSEVSKFWARMSFNISWSSSPQIEWAPLVTVLIPLYSGGLWLAVMLVAQSNGRPGAQLDQYIIGETASPTLVTVIPVSVIPLMKASWRVSPVSRLSRPTAMCWALYLRRRWVPVPFPMR